MDFSDIGFPGAAEDCESCHLPGTYDLPLLSSLPPTVTQIMDDTGALIGTAPPVAVTASNCTGCHDAPATAAHASLNTTDAGVEACATCHAAGKSFGVDIMHARPQWE